MQINILIFKIGCYALIRWNVNETMSIILCSAFPILTFAFERSIRRVSRWLKVTGNKLSHKE